MISLSQVIVPLAAVGTLDDSAFVPGIPDPWCAAFAAQVVAARANGTVCKLKVFVAQDVASRMFGANLPEVGPWNSPLSVQTFGPEYERIEVLCDVALAENSARIE